ncbi:MAG: glycosyltransferase family 2 protein [Armatimonadetes bacterium]|nr:glycosyltransferase family 2 protein [Armatimonadota bacterium]
MSDFQPSTAAHLLPISVCIVAHNEQENIVRTLRSVVGWAAQVIVLDCESSDATAAVAEANGAEIHHGPNLIPEISKNNSFLLARQEWILLLDADEIIPDPLKREIEQTLIGNPTQNGFRFPRRNFYFGTPLMHGGNYPDRQLRLFRRGQGQFPGKGYHETLIIDGTVGLLNEPFDHFTYPTFEVWLHKFVWYTRYEAEVYQKQGVAITKRAIWKYMILRPLRRWFKRLFLKQGIRDGVPGVLAATFDLMTKVVGFGRYWEMTKNKKR